MRTVLFIVLSIPIVVIVFWVAWQVRRLIKTYLARRRLAAAVLFSEAQLLLFTQRAMAQLLNEARRSLLDRQS